MTWRNVSAGYARGVVQRVGRKGHAVQHCYLIGKGIAHSKSPAMYNALYTKLGLDWTYEAADLASEEEARALLQSKDWLSVNATTPYKPLALATATVQAASVQLAGGANMLFVKQHDNTTTPAEAATPAEADSESTSPERLAAPADSTATTTPQRTIFGLNTDGVGCIRHIQRSFGPLTGARVVVCGTGPTSLAIFVAAATAGAARIALIGRSRDRTKAALDALMQRYKKLAFATLDLGAAREGDRTFREAFTEPDYVFGSYVTSTQEIAAADIIIDATPLGMEEGDPLPFSATLLGSQALVYDVVYGHGTSRLLDAATQAGVGAVLDGQGMLVAQAVENASVLLGAQDVESPLSWDDMFSCMADAAGFAC